MRKSLNRLQPKESDGSGGRKKKQFKEYDIGYVHIDITEIRLEKKRLYLFFGIDRVCKHAFFELHERMTQDIAKDFLTHLIEDFSFKIHTILTDNEAQFTYALLAAHLRPKNKDHTTKRYHYDSVKSLKKHLMAFLLAYNVQRPLKSLKFKSPDDIILENDRQKPLLFCFNPNQKSMGLIVLTYEILGVSL